MTVRLFKDGSVSMEIDGLANMQDVAGSEAEYRVSSKQPIWE